MSKPGALASPPSSLSASGEGEALRRQGGGEAQAHLLPLAGPDHEVVPLPHSPSQIGRAPNADVVVADPEVSRGHATIERQGQQYVIRDPGSLNGTFVNGQRLLAHEAVPLHHGDEVRLGTVPFRFLHGPGHFEPHVADARPALRLDDTAAEVYVWGRRLAVTPKEYATLRALWQRRGQLCSKECLAQQVWADRQGIVSDASIETAISRLRSSLHSAGGRRDWVATVARRGYRLALSHEMDEPGPG